MRYHIICTIIGQSTTLFPDLFSVEIDDARTVEDLKYVIKFTKAGLNDISVVGMTLYQVNIDASNKGNYTKEVGTISQQLSKAAKELNPACKLSGVFQPLGPSEGKIHILVQLHPVYTVTFLILPDTQDPSSIEVEPTSTIGKLADRVRTTMPDTVGKHSVGVLTMYKVDIPIAQDMVRCAKEKVQNEKALDHLQPLNKLYSSPPVGDTIHITIVLPPPGFLLLSPSRYAYHAVAQICQSYWGQQANITAALKSGDPIRLNSQELAVTDYWLYVFKQYHYMLERIDRFRKKVEMKAVGYLMDKDGIILVGTPGIGKTTFLHLYLAWELAQGKVAMYWAGDTLYLFAGQSTIYYTDRVSEADIDEYSSALCFIDSDSTSSPPRKLTGNGQLFILQAAPPIPRLTTWTKRRPKVVTFVLNPPSKPEAVQALQIHRSISADKVQIEMTVDNFGYNMRTLYKVLILGQQEHVKADMKEVADTLSLDRIRMVLGIGSELSDRCSDLIVMTTCPDQPQDEAGSDYYAEDISERTFSCPVVWEALLVWHGKLLYSQIRPTASFFKRVPQASSMTRWLWEGYGHNVISQGGIFNLVPMVEEAGQLVASSAESERIIITSLAPRIYTPLEPTNRSTKYYIPSALNNPTFDAFFLLESKQVALQMAFKRQHSLEPEGLTELTKRLPSSSEHHWAQYFVFVVPESNVETFNCRAPTDNHNFQFFMLRLEYGLLENTVWEWDVMLQTQKSTDSPAHHLLRTSPRDADAEDL